MFGVPLNPKYEKFIKMPVRAEKGCKFCTFTGEDRTALLNPETVEYSGVELRLITNGQDPGALLRARAISIEEDMYQDAVNINFCPVCGRRLGVEVDRNE